MSSRARYETKDGEFLTVSRGSLFIRDGESGITKEHVIVGSVTFDGKARKLSVPIRVSAPPEAPYVCTIDFEIVKDPGQIRASTRGAYVDSEKARLLGVLRATPTTIGADPSGVGADAVPGVPNPNHEKASAALRVFCSKYGLNLATVMGLKGQTAATTEEPVAQKPAKKKAKERRAEEAAEKAAEKGE